jgi:prepilin-type N-terminal cleavage/methylation domain-containing protein
MNQKQGRQSGYSLVELLTVVAIVGILGLVTVPAFITFYQSNKMKASMRNFTTDLRSVRQLAITSGTQAMLSYATGATARSYDIYLGNKPFLSTLWTARTGTGSIPSRGTRRLEDVVFFPTHDASATPPTPQTFVDEVSCSTLPCTAGTDSRIDVIFYPDGRVKLPTGITSASITLKTNMKIPKPQYTINISPSGRVQAN